LKTRYTVIAVLASCLIPVLAVNGELNERIALVFTALCGASILPIIIKAYSAVSQIKQKQCFDRGEIISFCLIGTLAISNIPHISFSGFDLCIFALLLSSSLVICAFEIKGSIWSTVCGIIWVAKGGDTVVALCLIFGGILGGLLANKRGGVLLGFLLADFTLTLMLTNITALSLGLPNYILGCAYTVFIPKNIMLKLKRLSGVYYGINNNEMSYVDGLRRFQKEKLDAWARMYRELSRAFTDSVKDGNYKKALVDGALKVCNACAKHEYCLASRKSDTVLELNSLADDILHDLPAPMPIPLAARCIKQGELLQALYEAQDELTEKYEENPTGESELAIQLKGISDMLYSLSDSLNELPQFDAPLEISIRDALLSRIGLVEYVSVKIKDDKRIITVCMRENRRTMQNEICLALKEAFIGDYCCISAKTDNFGRFSGTFAQMPKYSVDVFACQKFKKGEAVCGDAYSYANINGEKFYAAVSDGAGSGKRAALESESTLDLLEAFQNADISRNEMYKTINRLLLLKGDREAYSTLDVAELDLNSGILCLTKIGAVPCYILRGNKVERITSNELPIGIIAKLEPTTSKRLIQGGDTVVLVTDGVFDALCYGASDKIADMIYENKALSPKELSEKLLFCAVETDYDDDMTVLVMKISA